MSQIIPHANVTIISFTLSVEGLTITYSADTTNTLILDPWATCDLLKDCRFIKDFDFDRNAELVILFTKNCEDGGGKRYAQVGHELWCDFIRSFYFDHRVAELLLQHREAAKAIQKVEAKIITLLAHLGNRA